jgi:hypothetical protein
MRARAATLPRLYIHRRKPIYNCVAANIVFGGKAAMSFVPKIIPGGKSASQKPVRAAPRKIEQSDIVDITRLSRAFFGIRSIEDRLKIIVFIEELAEAERSEHWY